MQYFTMSGELLRVVGEPGRAPGQLWWPIGVALRGGLAFVSEARNNRVQVLGQSDGVVRQVVPFDSPPWPLEGKQHPQEVLHFALAGLCASAERLYVMTHSRVHIFSIVADTAAVPQ